MEGKALVDSLVGKRFLPLLLLTFIASARTAAMAVVYRSLALVVVWLTGVASGSLLLGFFIFLADPDEVVYRRARGWL
jgi:hypothetical protein